MVDKDIAWEPLEEKDETLENEEEEEAESASYEETEDEHESDDDENEVHTFLKYYILVRRWWRWGTSNSMQSGERIFLNGNGVP